MLATRQWRKYYHLLIFRKGGITGAVARLAKKQFYRRLAYTVYYEFMGLSISNSSQSKRVEFLYQVTITEKFLTYCAYQMED